MSGKIYINKVQLDVDDTAIRRLESEVDSITLKQQAVSGKLDYLILRSRSITSAMFRIFKESAATQAAEAALSISMTATSIHHTTLQAQAAFTRALTNPAAYIEGVALMAIAGSMGVNLAMTQQAMLLAKQQQAQVEQMRSFTEGYL